MIKKGVMAALALSFTLGAHAWNPKEYVIWHKIVSPGDLDGQVKGFRWERVWKEGKGERAVWKSQNRMFVYDKVFFSEVIIDLREWTTADKSGLVDFKVSSKIKVPVAGKKTNGVTGKREGDAFDIEVTDKKGRTTSATWPLEKFDEVWALERRYQATRRDIPVGAKSKVRFFKPLTNEMELVEIEAVAGAGDLVGYIHPFEKTTWTYWRNPANEVIRLDYKHGTWIQMPFDELNRVLPEKVKEKAGWSEAGKPWEN